MQKEKWEMCQRKFKDFEATKVVENEQILVIDWKNKNGSSEYAIRYTLDKEKGNFIITGDVGCCIARWYNPLSMENLASLINDIGYFKEKICCWTESYTYRYKDIEEDLNRLKEDLIAEGYDKEDLKKDFDEILSQSVYLNQNFEAYSDDLIDIFKKYDSDWTQSEFAYLGRRISDRIFFWAVGFQMAADGLSKKSQEKGE